MSDHPVTRREFVQRSAAGVLAASALPAIGQPMTADPLYRISLAQWSLHRELRAGELDHVDFPGVAKNDFGLDAVEYVSVFFKDARDQAHLGELKQRCDELGVRSLLIMVDHEGDIGDPRDAARAQTVDNHRKWLDAARFLGCHSIRVNAASSGTYVEQQRLAADGLRRLCELADPMELSVLVENHGGLSSNGAWLAGVMKLVDHPRCGTLPDFGNFCYDWSRADDPDAWYDRYQGVTELMPWARAVSAKSNDFDEAGNETNTDYRRMMKIVTGAGYRGDVGIEYEGRNLPEREGIAATKRLLERVRDELS